MKISFLFSVILVICSALFFQNVNAAGSQAGGAGAATTGNNVTGNNLGTSPGYNTTGNPNQNTSTQGSQTLNPTGPANQGVNQQPNTLPTDVQLKNELQQRFTAEKLGVSGSNVDGVKVVTNGGTIYLSGRVKTQEEAKRAEEIARSIEGVKNVESNITVE